MTPPANYVILIIRLNKPLDELENVMIDIDKLTEAQVRYILKMLIKFQWSDDVSNDVMVATELDDHPQQANNEESDND